MKITENSQLNVLIPVNLFLRQTDPGLGICIPQDTRKNGFSFREENDPLEKIYLEGLDK